MHHCIGAKTVSRILDTEMMVCLDASRYLNSLVTDNLKETEPDTFPLLRYRLYLYNRRLRLQ